MRILTKYNRREPSIKAWVLRLAASFSLLLCGLVEVFTFSFYGLSIHGRLIKKLNIERVTYIKAYLRNKTK